MRIQKRMKSMMASVPVILLICSPSLINAAAFTEKTIDSNVTTAQNLTTYDTLRVTSDGNISVSNSGSGLMESTAITIPSDYDGSINNAGTIEVIAHSTDSASYATGIYTTGASGAIGANIINSGTINVNITTDSNSSNAVAYGINLGSDDLLNGSIQNRGDININVTGGANGGPHSQGVNVIYVDDLDGSSITNSGNIFVDGNFTSYSLTNVITAGYLENNSTISTTGNIEVKIENSDLIVVELDDIEDGSKLEFGGNINVNVNDKNNNYSTLLEAEYLYGELTNDANITIHASSDNSSRVKGYDFNSDIDGGTLNNGGIMNFSATSSTDEADITIFEIDNIYNNSTIINTADVTAIANGEANSEVIFFELQSSDLEGSLSNSGDITLNATSSEEDATVYFLKISNDNIDGNITNTGLVTLNATSLQGNAEAYGIKAYELRGILDNSQDIQITVNGDHSASANGIVLDSVSGTLSNSGDIKISATTTNNTAEGIGIDVSGETLSGTFNNSGNIDIDVDASALDADGRAYGILSYEITGEFINTGDIDVDINASSNSFALGIYADYVDSDGSFDQNSTIDVKVTSATGNATTKGVLYDSGNRADLSFDGEVNVYASTEGSSQEAKAVALELNDLESSISENRANLNVTAIAQSEDATATAKGIDVYSIASDSALNNYGDITVVAQADNTVEAVAIEVTGFDGNITNSGDINMTTLSDQSATAYAIKLFNSDSSSTLINSANIEASVNGGTTSRAHGITIMNDVNGNVSNNANISLSSEGSGLFSYLRGIDVENLLGEISNSGDITLNFDNSLITYGRGINVDDLEGATFSNSGTITINALSHHYASYYGIKIEDTDANSSVENSGDIILNLVSYATEELRARGFDIGDLNTTVNNSGDINIVAQGDDDVTIYGIKTDKVFSNGTLTNSGKIDVNVSGKFDSFAYGISMDELADNITNSGEITVHATSDSNSSYSYGIFVEDDLNGTLTNNGSIVATADDTNNSFSIYVTDGVGVVNNMTGGVLSGNIYTGGSVTVDNAGTLSIKRGAQTHIAGNYNQTVDGVLQLEIDSTTDYASLHIGGEATFATDTTIDLDVTSANTLALDENISDVISAGSLDATTFTMTDNSIIFDFEAIVDGNSVDLLVVEGMNVEDILTNDGNKMGEESALVWDNLIHSGDGSDDMKSVITALGKLSSEKEVSDAVTETLPINTNSTANVTNHVGLAASKVVNARQSGGTKGVATGDLLNEEEYVWIKPFGSLASQDNKGGVNGYSANSYGFGIGYEGKLSDENFIGTALFFSDMSVDTNDVDQSTEVQSFNAMLYGSSELVNRSTYLHWQAGVGYQKNSSTRTITFMDRVADAQYDSLSALLSAKLTQEYELGEAMKLIPYTQAFYQYYKSEAYTESGADALNLDVSSNTADQLLMGVGTDIEYKIGKKTALLANFGIDYDALSSTGSITSSYVGGGSSFATPGIETSPWYYRGGIGLLMSQRFGLNISINYDFESRSEFSNQTASAKISWLF